jgi:hypothetical protein
MEPSPVKYYMHPSTAKQEKARRQAPYPDPDIPLSWSQTLALASIPTASVTVSYKAAGPGAVVRPDWKPIGMKSSGATVAPCLPRSQMLGKPGVRGAHGGAARRSAEQRRKRWGDVACSTPALVSPSLLLLTGNMSCSGHVQHENGQCP